MRTKTLLLSIMSLFFGIATCLAQNTLNIHQKSGGVVSYGFSEKPVVTYTREYMHVETVSVSIDYPVSNVQKLTFKDSESSIGELRVEEESLDLLIYNLKGQLVKKAESEDGISQLDIQELPAGIYLVKNGKTTFKIVKK